MDKTAEDGNKNGPSNECIMMDEGTTGSIATHARPVRERTKEREKERKEEKYKRDPTNLLLALTGKNGLKSGSLFYSDFESSLGRFDSKTLAFMTG